MTLLLTFFVLLLSFSSFDDKVFRKLEKNFGNDFPYISTSMKKDKDSFEESFQILYLEDPYAGSERPTNEQGDKNSLLKNTQVTGLDRKVFVTKSAEVFWGRGQVISREGRKTLEDLSLLLRLMPESRVVISESSELMDSSGDELGINRALVVMNFFSGKGVGKERLSISGSSLMSEENLRNGSLFKLASNKDRVLEITLLERSVYN